MTALVGNSIGERMVIVAARESDTYRAMGEPERAIPLRKQALSLYPKGRESIFGNLGMAGVMISVHDIK